MLELIRGRQIGKAAAILGSRWVADLRCVGEGGDACGCAGCAAVQELAGRHPRRRKDMPLPDEFEGGARVTLDCRKRVGGLERQKAAGLTSLGGDHLRALATGQLALWGGRAPETPRHICSHIGGAAKQKPTALAAHPRHPLPAQHRCERPALYFYTYSPLPASAAALALGS